MKKYREYVANVLPAVFFGLLCGLVVGVSMFFFKFGAQKVTALSEHLYKAAGGSPLYIALLFAVLFLLALGMIFLHKKMPDCKGGGIPLSEGILRGLLSFNWWKTLVGTAIGSMISFFCGLPLGSEGPAVAMGTALGCMCGKITGNRHAYDRYVMTGGAGAGFAVATGAPLSAMLFALEEIHKRFTPMLVLTVSMSVLSATAVNRFLSGLFGISANLFEVGTLASFKLSHMGWLLLLGVLTALAVGGFDASIVLFGSLTSKIAKVFTRPVKIVLIFLLTGLLGLTFSDALYSGHHTVLEVAAGHKTVSAILLLLALRMLLMLLITDSGVTGGIFVPTLAIGALCGALIVKLLIACGMPEELYGAAVLLSMCAFMGGMLRSPLVSAVLFAEITGQ
ncbi:MAG: chloride channel protein, partial [Clostridia bacterium]|nr:chloride channel protein [Clostridia bacterium]